MICFQIVFFDILQTEWVHRMQTVVPLWFAFKLCSLIYCKQMSSRFRSPPYSCDLLSNCVLWYIANRHYPKKRCNKIVVICFQIVFFDILQTDVINSESTCNCCDLLSNCVLWYIANRTYVKRWRRFRVVICFQIVFFDILQTENNKTTKQNNSCDLLSNCVLWYIANRPNSFIWQTLPLWFAFKLCSLIYCKQIVSINSPTQISCDLLSNCVLWYIANRIALFARLLGSVVICFQIVFFDILQTDVGIKSLRHL